MSETNNKEYLDFRQIQLEELKILKYVIEFLKENKINYYIYAGTFLGAVRHKGFIPWDDDIDIAITRPEYDKLIALLKNNCDINDEIMGIAFELGNSDRPFLKFINKRISVHSDIHFDKNLYIDVFPLDAIPEKSRNYYKKILFLKKLYFVKRADYYNKSIKSIKIGFIYTSIFKYILRLVNYNDFIQFYIDYCKKYNYDNCTYVNNNVWGLNDYERKISKLDLIDTNYIFEETEVNGMKNYDDILTNIYGDYMKLPPIEKRITHHELKVWKQQ